MGLLDSIRPMLLKKDKTEVDYGLEKLIIKAERLPIYYNWYDFQRGKLMPPDLILGNLEKQRVENRIKANNKRLKNVKSKIQQIFDPVMEQIKKDVNNEKNSEKAERIVAEYRKAEKIVKDYETRAEGWSVVGDQILCSEYNIPARWIIVQGCDYGKHGKVCGKLTGQGYYSKESMQENFKALHEVEIDYAKYNNGQGLMALREAAKMIDDWQRIHIEKWDYEQRSQEQLSGEARSDSYQSFIDKTKIQDNRRPFQARLTKIYNERSSSAEVKERSSLQRVGGR